MIIYFVVFCLLFPPFYVTKMNYSEIAVDYCCLSQTHLSVYIKCDCHFQCVVFMEYSYHQTVCMYAFMCMSSGKNIWTEIYLYSCVKNTSNEHISAISYLHLILDRNWPYSQSDVYFNRGTDLNTGILKPKSRAIYDLYMKPERILLFIVSYWPYEARNTRWWCF